MPKPYASQSSTQPPDDGHISHAPIEPDAQLRPNKGPRVAAAISLFLSLLTTGPLALSPASAQTLQVIRPGESRIGLPHSESAEEAPDEAFSSLRQSEENSSDLQQQDKDTASTPQTQTTPRQGPSVDPNTPSKGCPAFLTPEDISDLYPSGSALIRFFNATSSGREEKEKTSKAKLEKAIRAKSLNYGLGPLKGSLLPLQAGAYAYLPQGTYTATLKSQAGTTTQQLTFFPGMAYTIVASFPTTEERDKQAESVAQRTHKTTDSTEESAPGLQAAAPVVTAVLKDTLPQQAKAMLTLYNLTDHEALALTTGRLQTTLFAAVAQGVSSSLSLRPVELRLTLKQPGAIESLTDIAPHNFAAGRSYSIFATGSGEEIEGHVIPSLINCQSP